MVLDAYRDVGDLYIEGKVLPLRNGMQIWVQVLNSFEMEECRTAARVRKAQVINALQDEGSQEAQMMRAEFRIGEREQMLDHLANSKSDEYTARIVAQMDGDPDWATTLDLVRGSSSSQEPTEDERNAIMRATEHYIVHIQARLQEEIAAERQRLSVLDDDQLEKAAVDRYIEMRGNTASLDEFRLHEMALASRRCKATWHPDAGVWVHELAPSERTRIWTVDEVRALPHALQVEIQDTLKDLNISTREVKDSAAQAGSSNLSPQPSVEEAFIPSGPMEMPPAPLGT